MLRSWSLGAIVLTALLLNAHYSEATPINPAAEFTSGSATNYGGQTVGFRFHVNSTLTVNALGLYDDGWSGTWSVGIWDSDG